MLVESIQIWLSKPEEVEVPSTDEFIEDSEEIQSTDGSVEEEVFVTAPKYDSETQQQYEKYMQDRFDARLQTSINTSYHTPEGLNDDGTPTLVREDAFYISHLDVAAAEALDEWVFENVLVKSQGHTDVAHTDVARAA
ncbi:13994_t:CDS:1 [Acaulospora colombiana]|uniref:13994_t:CDS:1 n=1 Tax=Acaulospora colombiana TaxID=27376 RepID=A0ACA9KP54_9GLOM|nr:13994_t:CDS:1 [Acaulospora colombiana]